MIKEYTIGNITCAYIPFEGRKWQLFYREIDSRSWVRDNPIIPFLLSKRRNIIIDLAFIMETEYYGISYVINKIDYMCHGDLKLLRTVRNQVVIRLTLLWKRNQLICEN